jgi:hypothetical protein
MPLLKAARRESQRFLRFVLRWYFLFLFGIFLMGTFDGIRDVINGKYVSWSLLGEITTVLILPVFTAVFGMACWTIWREKNSARKWVVAACLANLVMSIGVPLRFYYLWGASACWQMVYIFALPAVIGVAGLFFFSPPEKQPQTGTKAQQISIRARMALAWIFGPWSLGCLWGAVHIIYRNHAVLPLRMLVFLVLLLAAAVVFAAAWWNIWREKPSADAWGFAASLVTTLMFLGETIESWPPDLAHNLAHSGDWLFTNMGALLVGLAGLVLFSENYWKRHSMRNTSEPVSQLPGKPAPLE